MGSENYPRIYVEDIWICDLFGFFEEHIKNSGGDGCGFIICKNYEECAQWFKEWYINKYPTHTWFSWELHSDLHSAFYLDGQDNYVFTDQIPRGPTYSDYVFIVWAECRFGYKSLEDKRRLYPVEGLDR